MATSQLSLADVSETVGVATCNALQGEFGKEMVTFIPTDVTDSVQLVSVCVHHTDNGGLPRGGLFMICTEEHVSDDTRCIWGD